MFDKKKWLYSITTMLMTFAVIIPMNGSWLFIGEPELPISMKK